MADTRHQRRPTSGPISPGQSRGPHNGYDGFDVIRSLGFTCSARIKLQDTNGSWNPDLNFNSKSSTSPFTPYA